MIGGGEILRAIATSSTKTRKQKYYTTTMNFSALPGVGTTISNRVVFEKNTSFLWMSCTVTAMRAGVGNSRTLVPADYLVDFELTATGQKLQLDDQLAMSVFSERVNEVSDFQEYYLFDSNESLTVNLTTTVNSAFLTNVYVTLSGVEYRS